MIPIKRINSLIYLHVVQFSESDPKKDRIETSRINKYCIRLADTHTNTQSIDRLIHMRLEFKYKFIFILLALESKTVPVSRWVMRRSTYNRSILWVSCFVYIFSLYYYWLHISKELFTATKKGRKGVDCYLPATKLTWTVFDSAPLCNK